MLYLGDEDTFATPANNPRAVFRSIYTDTGVVASGNWWNEGNQLYYAAFVTNGLVGVDDLAGGAGFSDNNNNKQIGARVAYTMSFETSRLGFGASWMTGKYDTANRLSYRMYGADFIFVLDGLFGGDGSLTLRGEYVFAPREINPPTTTDPSARLNEANRTQGGYLLVELMVRDRPGAFGAWVRAVKRGKPWEQALAEDFGVTRAQLVDTFVRYYRVND